MVARIIDVDKLKHGLMNSGNDSRRKLAIVTDSTYIHTQISIPRSAHEFRAIPSEQKCPMLASFYLLSIFRLSAVLSFLMLI